VRPKPGPIISKGMSSLPELFYLSIFILSGHRVHGQSE
jgi:hypothetical protein